MASTNSYAVIIQARTNSTRLEDKMIMPFYQKQTILQIIISKLKERLNTIPIILATTDNEADDILVDSIEDFNIPVFRGDEKNVLKRMLDAASENDVENIVRVCADNPFLNVESIIDLINFHKENNGDYVSYKVDEDTPAILSHFGFYAELTTKKALKNALKSTKETQYLEHVTNYIYSNPDRFKLHFIKAPGYLYNRSDIRLTVDTIDDFQLAQSIYTSMIENDWTQNDLITFIDSREDILYSMSQSIERNRK